MTQPHSKSSLTRDLKRLGLAEGDGVFVHASMRAVGPVDGGAHALISAVLDVVGKGGLVGMPGFCDDAYPPDDIDADTLSSAEIARIEYDVPGFDAERSPTTGMGILAETFRTWPGTKRSAHPTTSVCLNGPDAAAIASPHADAWSMGPASPFGRMRSRAGMKILLLGVQWTRCTPLHTAESYARHQRRKIRRFKSGPGAALWYQTPDVADDLGRIFPRVGEAFEATGKVHEGMVGDAPSLLCGYDDLVSFAAQWIGAENKRTGSRL